MKKIYNERRSVISVDQIDADLIDLLYSSEPPFIRHVVGLCMNATHKELFNVLLALSGNSAGELANILCVETRLYTKKFSRRNVTSESFVLYRCEVPITKILWQEYKSHSKISVLRATEGLRYRRRFNSLLQVHGIIDSQYLYKNIQRK